MSTQLFTIRRATDKDVDTIIRLIDEASRWLRLKETDQWARPWPDEQSRRRRILDGLRTGITYLAHDGEVAVATVSMTSEGNPMLWRPDELCEPAVYLHRLVIDRKYAGQGLGAALLEWAAQQGRRLYGAKTMRIDVWQDNQALHAYYRKLGFQPPNGSAEPEIRVREKDRWPSGAVFQRVIPHPDAYRRNRTVDFVVEEPSPEIPALGSPQRAPAARGNPVLALASSGALLIPALLSAVSRYPGA